MSRVNTRVARSRPAFDRLTLIVLVVFIVLAIVTAVLAFVWARSFFATTGIIDVGGAPPVNPSGTTVAGKGSETGNNSAVSPGSPLQPEGSGPTPAPWDGSTRVTILVMGLDYRDWSEGTDVPRTDTMILFSVDPLSKTAGMLSIPRDMWVTIPGMENNKINTAYRWGEIYKLPGGGPGLAMKTVEQFLGVPVNYYALIDFNSFVRFIDALGGLKLDIKEEIKVDPIGPGNTVVLKPGVQTLDGATVLAYARNRYTGGDDFDRSARQQEVIMAVRDRILTLNMLPTLVAKAPQLYQELAAGIRTNLSLDQVIRLAWLAKDINVDAIKRGIIGPPKQVEFATNPSDGQAILIPVPDQIRILRDEVFATGGPVGPAAVAEDPAELMKTEQARILLRNGTTTPGLAGKTSDLLKGLGMNITGEDNADQAYSVTTIIDYTGKPYTARYLIEQMKIPNARVINRFDPNSSVDLEIILGEDWAAQN